MEPDIEFDLETLPFRSWSFNLAVVMKQESSRDD